MKKMLLVPSPGIWPMLEFEIDLLQTLLDNDYNVTYFFCKSKYPSCIANKERSTDLRNPFKCLRCESITINALKILSDKSRISIINNSNSLSRPLLKNIINKLKVLITNEKINASQIQKLVDIEGVDIYSSALSTLMSTLKDAHPDINKFRWLLYDYLYEALDMYFIFKQLLIENKYDKIVIFNGRMCRYRPIVRLCKIMGLPFEVMEYPEYSYDKYILTPNQYPHDFSYRSQILRDFVEKSDLKYSTMLTIGDQLIQDSIKHNESHGIGIGNYVSHQKKDQMPLDWDERKFNVVIFTSSDFENAGIPEYYNNLPGGNQISTINMLRNILPSEIHFTVRIHPNQKDKDLISAKKIEEIASDQITVIKAYEGVDSYTLAKKTDIVITFGSQLSVESAYLGKHVIVFGNSYYTAFSFSKNVLTVEEASNLILNDFRKDENIFGDIANIKKEACLHMFARKFQGVTPKYLIKNNYYGGELTIDGKSYTLKANKLIYVISKYFGFPFIIINEYRAGGIENVFLLVNNLFKS